MRQRRIRISIMAPVVVDMLVMQSTEADPEDPWEIKTIFCADYRGTMSARFIHENTDESTIDEIDRLARAAPEYKP